MRRNNTSLKQVKEARQSPSLRCKNDFTAMIVQSLSDPETDDDINDTVESENSLD